MYWRYTSRNGKLLPFHNTMCGPTTGFVTTPSMSSRRFRFRRSCMSPLRKCSGGSNNLGSLSSSSDDNVSAAAAAASRRGFFSWILATWIKVILTKTVIEQKQKAKRAEFSNKRLYDFFVRQKAKTVMYLTYLPLVAQSWTKTYKINQNCVQYKTNPLDVSVSWGTVSSSFRSVT